MPRHVITALAVAVVVSFGYSLFYRHSRNEWESRVEVALKDANAARAQAEVYGKLAAEYEARAAALDTVATERVRVVRERVVEIREVEVPAIAQPFVAARDSIIDELLVAVDEKDEVISGHISAAEAFRLQIGLLTLRGDSLVAVLEDRPDLRKWWVPQSGVGGFLGMCSGGSVCTGIGLTFSWSF